MSGMWKGVASRIGRLIGRPTAAREARSARSARGATKAPRDAPSRTTPTPSGTTPTPSRSTPTPSRTAPVPKPARPDRRPTPAPMGGRRLVYAPQLDGQADPGEIVWTWVAYEDDPSQGKDRPVLVVGREGAILLGLMLSSQGERDGQRNWLALGPGDWDRESRPSWVRLDRVLKVAEDGIRREGAVLDQVRFERIAKALRRGYGWG